MIRLFRKLLRRRTLDREIAAELAFHREMAQAGGNAVPLGNQLLIREAAADPWRFVFLETLWQDTVSGLRALRRSPILALAAVGALALGIGSTTAVFSLVNAVLLKPVPVPDPESFVMLMTTAVSADGSASYPGVSPAKFAHWRSESSVLQDVSAYMPGKMNLSGGGFVGQVASMWVSADAFRCWGTPMILGRSFSEQEDSPGGPRVAVLGRDFWRQAFAGDPGAVGQAISLDGDVYTVIGVAAENPFLIEQGPSPDVYIPFQLDPNSRDQTRLFRATARLKPGVTGEQANARLQVSSAEFRAKFPGALGPRDLFAAVPYRDYLTGAATGGSDRPLLMVLLSAVFLVLLIACANVANLLMVRAESRKREMAIRASIGAGRARVIRQLLTESLLLSVIGGALGLVLGLAGLRALLAVNTGGLPRLGPDGVAVGMDWRVMIFALALSLATGILFGWLPAVSASRIDLNSFLKDGGPSAGAGIRRNRIRAALAAGQAALAVVLLIGSALLIRTFVALYSVNTGLDLSNVTTMRMRMTRPEFAKAARVAGAMQDGLQRIRALPGVESATATYFIPLETAIGSTFDIVGQPPSRKPFIGWVPTAPGYFDVFKIPLKHGRAFTDRDDAQSPAVVMINESMARLYWKDGDPLKDRILIGRGGSQFRGEPPRQIIGIVGDVRDTQLSNEIRPTMYVPQAQITDAMNSLLVRIQPVAWIVRSRGPASLPSIREQLLQSTGLPVGEIRSMGQVESGSIARQRFNMLLMTVFGVTALLLAAVGIYGLMAYSVEQRSREIGIRLALGADARRVRRTVVFEGMRLALAGAAIGLALAFDLTHFLAGLLFGVQPRDPVVFISVPIVLSAVALFSVWVPANRASRVDAMQALRYE